LETCRRIEDLVDFIAGRYSKAAEIGIGHFPDVAFALLRKGIKVFATDIRQFHYRGLQVVIDDITVPDISLYDRIDLIYSMRPPPELIPYMKRLAGTVSADLLIRSLSSEYIEGYRFIRNGDSSFFWGNYQTKGSFK
jgi:uncharacterized protein